MSFKNQNELIGGVNEIIGGLNASRTKANLKKLKKLEKMDFKFLDQTGGKIMKETLNMLHENYDKECENKPALLKKNYITSIRKQSLGGGGRGVTKNGNFMEAMKEVLDMVGGATGGATEPAEDLATLHDQLSEDHQKLVELKKACREDVAGVTAAWNKLKDIIQSGDSDEVDIITKLSIGGVPGLDTDISAAVEACVNYRENKNCEKLRQLKVNIEKKKEDAKLKTEQVVSTAAGEVDAANVDKEQAANVVTEADRKVAEAHDSRDALIVTQNKEMEEAKSKGSAGAAALKHKHKVAKAKHDAAIAAAETEAEKASALATAAAEKYGAAQDLKQKAEALHEANSNALKAPSTVSPQDLTEAKAARADAVTAHADAVTAHATAVTAHADDVTAHATAVTAHTTAKAAAASLGK